MDPELSARIRRTRLAKGWTQEDLVRAAHVSHSTASQVDSGKQMPSAFTLHQLASALECSVDRWLQGLPTGTRQRSP